MPLYIPRLDSHTDLGIILSEDLSWDKHYKSITARAYKMLGLIRCTLLPSHSTSTMVKLYVSLVLSQLFYCTQIWHPHLMKDILNIERVKRHATKYILNDYTSCYKTHLIKLRLLPLIRAAPIMLLFLPIILLKISFRFYLLFQNYSQLLPISICNRMGCCSIWN